jgi:hypothetical protein
MANSSRLGALQFEDGSLFSGRNGYGVTTSPRDFARIGWFWLNKGNWNGQQLLPQIYFEDYMKPGVPSNLPRTSGSPVDDYLGTGTEGGGANQTTYGPGIYGFNWWFNAQVPGKNALTWPDAPSDTFQANGHWSREIVTVIPSLNMVVAAYGNWGTFAPGDRNSMMNQNLKLLKDSVISSPSITPSSTFTPTGSPTNTTSPTLTGTSTQTFTPTSTFTSTVTPTPSLTMNSTPTTTGTPTSTKTPIPSSTPELILTSRPEPTIWKTPTPPSSQNQDFDEGAFFPLIIR